MPFKTMTHFLAIILSFNCNRFLGDNPVLQLTQLQACARASALAIRLWFGREPRLGIHPSDPIRGFWASALYHLWWASALYHLWYTPAFANSARLGIHPSDPIRGVWYTPASANSARLGIHPSDPIRGFWASAPAIRLWVNKEASAHRVRLSVIRPAHYDTVIRPGSRRLGIHPLELVIRPAQHT